MMNAADYATHLRMITDTYGAGGIRTLKPMVERFNTIYPLRFRELAAQDYSVEGAALPLIALQLEYGITYNEAAEMYSSMVDDAMSEVWGTNWTQIYYKNECNLLC